MMNLGHAFRTFKFRFRSSKKNRAGDFVRRKRYSLQLVNLSSLEKVVEVRARKRNIILSVVLVFILIGVIWFCAFRYTALGNLFPGRMPSQLRSQYEQMSVRLDSALIVMGLNDLYTQNVLNALQDTLPSIDERDSAGAIALPLDSLLETSNIEKAFVKKFEDAERFNLSVLSPIAAEGMTFFAPVKGAIATERVSDSGIPYVYALPGKTTPVSAAYRGTVVNTYYTTGRGITVTIQHPNDFMSTYAGLSECFVSKGDKVNAGSRIGLAQDGKYPFMFELWHNGSPLAPTDYIEF